MAVGCTLVYALICVTSLTLLDASYPISASWFKDRYSRKEWDETLDSFRKFGGDTVWLRAPHVVRRSSAELGRDPSFVWCGSEARPTKVGGARCWKEAEQELSHLGLKVSGFLSYQYEEDFGPGILQCPKYDRRLNSSRIYHRIVIPVSPQRGCDFPNGTEVFVLLTSFAGTDPHEILLESAMERNITVFFGLPSLPVTEEGFDLSLINVYYNWVQRVLEDHKQRFSRKQKSLYHSLEGYYSTDEVCLAQVVQSSSFSPSLGGIYLSLYGTLGKMVRQMTKKFSVSPFIDLTRAELNATVSDHVRGFSAIARLGRVDIIAVQEGRGAGKGCYYWDTQIDLHIRSVDALLYDLLEYRRPETSPTDTFRQTFSSSNQIIFRSFAEAHDTLKQEGFPFEFWLNVEAFEYTREDPCLPVDVSASGMGELLARTSRTRLDRALTVAGAAVQKVITFAWDSDYTCTTHTYNQSLADSVIEDGNRPMISNCSFHSPQNLSVVVIGYNMAGETQSFTIYWTDTSGRPRKDILYGYYFELDYGARNDRVESLQYVMLWDTYEWQDLSPNGHVTVTAEGAYNECIFVYDYS